MGERRREAQDNRPVLRIGHSPDPDDAFMWFPITGIDGAPPLIDTGRFRYEAAPDDIESLNRRSSLGELEITAISFAQYPYIADQYALTSCGASMGFGYGPKLVAREPIPLEEIRAGDRSLAAPGERTSAFMATGLMLGGRPGRVSFIDFAEIMPRVERGEFDAGLIIHEGQLTFGEHGLMQIADLGQWWSERTGLPMPLGGNAVRRDLDDRFGVGTLGGVTATLLRSIRYAMDHRDEAIEYALRFGRGLSRELAGQFVSMYVNERTLDMGPDGREAARRFLSEAGAVGLAPRIAPSIEFINPTGCD